jgi:hypothetical protein
MYPSSAIVSDRLASGKTNNTAQPPSKSARSRLEADGMAPPRAPLGI